jgi:predicted metal-dependent hydrolase
VHQVALGSERVGYRIRRHTRARRITMRVIGGEVVVTAPIRTALGDITAFVESQGGWLTAALARGRADVAAPIVIGDQIPLLGDWLGVGEGAVRRARRIDDRLVVARGVTIDAQIERWYRGVAREHFAQLMDLWAPQIGVEPARLVVRGQRSRWGSASVHKTISINWRLVMAPPEVAEYVMVHELVHLVHMNHAPAFWARVAIHWPTHPAERAWLGTHGARLLSGPHPRVRDAGDVCAVG